MIRKSLISGPPLFLTFTERRKCLWSTDFILLQCVIIICIGFTVINCVWHPGLISFDPYKLASVMYLYDEKSCEDTTTEAKHTVMNVRLSNNTMGYNVLPLRWTPAIVTVSTRLSHKTRTYIELSMMIHFAWMLVSVAFRIIVSNNKNYRLLRFSVQIYFYVLVFINIFDLSMAIVYVTHIKQALTKGMIVRYSGWSVELKLKNYDDFAGYLPLIAAVCWMRGIVILGLNIYSCKILNDIQTKMKKNIMTRLNFTQHKPLPEPKNEETFKSHTLYYRPGEEKPYANTSMGGQQF